MEFEHRYSLVDRSLHRLSFSTLQIQVEFAGIEERLFGKEINNVEIRKPVFITALPRAATTLLLELCTGLDEFATHCYRDMPFVLLPLLWNRFSKQFRRSDKPRERAHGDGMLVSVDSPEAFEEMIWKTMWPDQYQADRIRPWEANANSEFLQYLVNHFKKIVVLRQRNSHGTPRYISKNNANIARIDWLANAFPDALFIVPYRNVAQHAASLLNQHIKFLDIHKQDSFASKYMAGIGHFDFGQNLRPIDFNGWIDKAHYQDPTTLGFWVEYWTNSYDYLLNRQIGSIQFLSYDALCADSNRTLLRLAELLSVKANREFRGKATDIQAGKTHDIDLSDVDDLVKARANNVFERLNAKSIV